MLPAACYADSGNPCELENEEITASGSCEMMVNSDWLMKNALFGTSLDVQRITCDRPRRRLPPRVTSTTAVRRGHGCRQ
jgi:hypothetical protein